LNEQGIKMLDAPVAGSTGHAKEGTLGILVDGCIDVLIGSVDIGQGTRTLMRQIAAEEMGLPIEMVSVTLVDTDTTVHSMPAHLPAA
jgi:CO/xanthine dehydrogenase Mo-binding subunit